jgi:hypothetical protein
MAGLEKLDTQIKRHGGRRPSSGRKKGTPNKAMADIREAAREYTAEGLAILIAVARNSDSDAARVSAVKELLDRGYGKAAQERRAVFPDVHCSPAQRLTGYRTRPQHYASSISGTD